MFPARSWNVPALWEGPFPMKLEPPKKTWPQLRSCFKNIMTISRKTYPRKKNNKHHYPKPPSTNRGVELFDLGRVTFIKLSNPHVGSTCENRMGCTVWPVPTCSHSTSSSYAGLENTVGCVAKPKKTLMYYLRMVCEQFVPSTSDTFGRFWRWVHNIRDFSSHQATLSLQAGPKPGVNTIRSSRTSQQ